MVKFSPEFIQFALWMLGAEGGLKLSKLPGDSGGYTYGGVTWATYQWLSKSLGMPGTWEHFTQMTQEDIVKFAAWFYNAVDGAKMHSQAVAYFITDWAFNAGPGNAEPAVQRILNAEYNAGLSVDGQIGAKTVAVINSKQAVDLLPVLKRGRDAYNSKTEIYKVYPEGLDNRVKKAILYAINVLSSEPVKKKLSLPLPL